MIQITPVNTSNFIIPQNSIWKKRRYSWDSRQVEELKKLCHPRTKTLDLNTLKYLRYDLIFKLYRALNPQNLSTPEHVNERCQSIGLDITRFMQHKSITSLQNRFHEQFGYAPTIVKKDNKILLTCAYKIVGRAPAILPSSLLGKVISFLPGSEALSAQRINSQFREESFAQEAFKEHANELTTAFVREMIKTRQDTAWELPDAINSKRHTIVKLDCSHLPITEEELHKVIELFPNLKTLSLDGCRLTIEHMTHLATCRHLEELDLNDASVQDIYLRDLPLSLKKLRCSNNFFLTDDALLHLTNKHNLEELNIGCNDDIKGTHFAALPISLKKLWCHHCRDLQDASLSHLSNHHNLEELNIRNTHITGTHFEDLPISLKKLDCSSTSLTDETLAQLANKYNLEELDIWHTPLIGTHFRDLPTSLKSLHCSYTPLVDEALAQLANKYNLEELDISHTPIKGTHFRDLPTSLKILWCNHCKYLQDASLSHLSNHHNLKTLGIRMTTIQGTHFRDLPTSLRRLDSNYCRFLTDEADSYLIEHNL